MTHTPGPWHTRNNGHGGTMVEGPQGVVYNLRDEDARLIAAAPKMLAALKTIRDKIYLNSPWLEIVQDAIAEAEGKS